VLGSRYVLVLGLTAFVTAGWNLYVSRHNQGLVQGRVVGPDGRPVGGATVTLFERTLTTREPRAATRTDADGAFRFTGHRAHHLVLEAAKDGVGSSPRITSRLYFRGQNVVLPEPLRLEARR
jgi:protocatechuate 3,4-dioxygenase beta subunit